MTPQVEIRRLAGLRSQHVPATPLANMRLTEGVWIDIDPQAQITGTVESPLGRLAEVRSQIDTPGRWMGLHVGLPGCLDLTHVAYFGAVIRSAAALPVTARVCLRSQQEDGFHDCFFSRDLVSEPEQSDHVDVIVPAHRIALPKQATWRQLIVFLPADVAVTWSLHDLRLIVL